MASKTVATNSYFETVRTARRLHEAVQKLNTPLADLLAEARKHGVDEELSGKLSIHGTITLETTVGFGVVSKANFQVSKLPLMFAGLHRAAILTGEADDAESLLDWSEAVQEYANRVAVAKMHVQKFKLTGSLSGANDAQNPYIVHLAVSDEAAA